MSEEFDPLEFCPFPKHHGEPWDEVVEEDPGYVRWLIGGEGPEVDAELYDCLTDLLEEAPDE